MHGIISSFRNAEHHLQTIFDLPFTLLTAGQQLLQGERNSNFSHRMKKSKSYLVLTCICSTVPSAVVGTWWSSGLVWWGRRRWSWPVHVSVGSPTVNKETIQMNTLEGEVNAKSLNGQTAPPAAYKGSYKNITRLFANLNVS